MIASLISSLGSFVHGSGIPEVKTILGGITIRGFFGLKTLLLKSFALVNEVYSRYSVLQVDCV